MLCEINPLIVTPGGRGEGARREGHGRRLGALPPPGPRRAARHGGGRSARGVRAREGRHLREARRHRSGSSATAPASSMSTVDVVVAAGGRPANFCDLGGGGSADGVVDALEVITRDPQVRSILFNIFGGITRCDEVARGILDGARPARHRRARSSSGSTARTPRRAAGSSRTPAAPNLHVEPTMLDGRAPRRGAGRMTDLWSERAELYRTSAAHSGGPDLDLSSSGRPGCATALDVATGGGHVARRLREAGLEVVTLRPGAGDAARRRLLRRGAALRRRELRRVAVHARRRAPLRRRRPPPCRRWRASPRRASWSIDNRLRQRARRGGGAAPRPVATSATTARRSGARFFARAGLESRTLAHFDLPARARAVARPRRAATARTPTRVRELARRPRRRTAVVTSRPVALRAGRRRLMAILVDRRHAPRRPGPDRQRGPLPRAAQPRLRDERRRRRHAREGRPGRRGDPGVRHGRRGGRARPARTPRSSSCPARFAADAIYEAVDAGIATVDLHHRARPGARHAPRLRRTPRANGRRR